MKKNTLVRGEGVHKDGNSVGAILDSFGRSILEPCRKLVNMPPSTLKKQSHFRRWRSGLWHRTAAISIIFIFIGLSFRLILGK